jgi:hypothetical protein
MSLTENNSATATQPSDSNNKTKEKENGKEKNNSKKIKQMKKILQMPQQQQRKMTSHQILLMWQMKLNQTNQTTILKTINKTQGKLQIL